MPRSSERHGDLSGQHVVAGTARRTRSGPHASSLGMAPQPPATWASIKHSLTVDMASAIDEARQGTVDYRQFTRVDRRHHFVLDPARPDDLRNATVGVSLDRDAFARVFIDRIAAPDAHRAAGPNPA
jgi:hypothetical protein